MTHLRPPSRPRPDHTAFTLVELMISIALVVLLILGVNQVFLYTSQAVGSGQAINDAIRNGRSIQQTMGADLANAVPNGLDANSSAGLVITSTSVYGFRNAADLAGDRDGNPATIDLQADGLETDPGDVISPFRYGTRNYRTDTISFFARGRYPRQTGGSGLTGAFVTNMSSDEAWVWYGHLQLPDNSAPNASTQTPTVFVGAGAGPTAGPNAGATASPAVNPNNYFAEQFVIGREAVLLRPTAPAAAGNAVPGTTIFANGVSGVSQPHIGLSGAAPYWSLSATCAASDGTGFGLADSRYDLAAGTIPQFQANLVAWMQPTGSAAAARDWWTATNYPHAFHCNPFVPKPLTPQGMAQALPYFVRGCTQFTVEFAGDFVTQNNDPTDVTYNNSGDTRAGKPDALVSNQPKPSDGTYGDVITDGGDGVLDFFVDKSADPNNPALWSRHIRWYGLPRDDNGDGHINGFKGSYNSLTAGAATQSNNDLLDVVPVRDVVLTALHTELLPATTHGVGGYSGENFEWFPSPDQTSDNSTNNPVAKPMADYAAVTPTGVSPTNIPAYTAAFGPFDPRVKLVRVTITLNDPTGRLRDGQTYQYVFPVGAK